MSITQDKEKVKPEIQLTKTAIRLYGFLTIKFDHWKNKKLLGTNGSFFLSDTEIKKTLAISRCSVKRARKLLTETSKIKYFTHQGRGKAITYLLLERLQKKQIKNTSQPETLTGLDPVAVKELAKIQGKEKALVFWQNRGYKKPEIEACF